MNIEYFVTIIVAILSSGLISTCLNRHWSKIDAKKAEEHEHSAEVLKALEERELNNRMLKKLFRANLNRTINSVRDRLGDANLSDSMLRLEVTELHDDMKDYFEMGGNGATHAAYVELYKEIARVKPELISIVWLDFISNDVNK